MKTTFGKRLQELAKMYSQTQTEMRERLDFPKSTFSLYWNDKRSPKQNIIGYISEKYNVQPAWLMGYDVPMRESTETELPTEEFRQEDFEILKMYHALSDEDKSTIVKMMQFMSQ